MRIAAIRAAICLLGLATAGCSLNLVKSGPFPVSNIGSLAVDVKPGDVVHVTTWVYSSTGTAGNSRPPTVETLRLPIRQVSAITGAATALLPQEAAFLGNVLGTARTNAFQNGDAPAAVAKQLEDNQIALWNGLVASLVLVKDQSNGYGQIHVKALACSTDVSKPCDLSPFCEVLNKLTETKEYFDMPCENGVGGHNETRRLNSYVTPLMPLTERQGGAQSVPYYVDGSLMAASGELERSAARLVRPAGIEARWSLAAWAKSGICADGPAEAQRWTISRIRIRTPTGERQVRVVPEKAEAKPEFTVRIKDLAAPPGPRTAPAGTIEGDRWVDRDEKGERGTLAAASLDLLYPSDIVWIQWRDAAGRVVREGRVPAERRALCFAGTERP